MKKEDTPSYECLRIENQLCFPLYACAKEVVRRYKPYLDALGLTYTQYITMLVLWEYGTSTVKALGEYLYLDSGTLTPLLKKLEERGLITRVRDRQDERNLNIALTAEGEKLKEDAVKIPAQIGGCLCITPEDAETLYRILYRILQKKD